MELRVLRYFLTVAKEQSFTKAAEQLHITQPTLSRQLAALEEELGTALFNRGGRWKLWIWKIKSLTKSKGTRT